MLHRQVSVNFTERESFLLAPYAFKSCDSKGRKHADSQHPYRSPFQRDRDRIVHCAAFRRLSEKMQVFTLDLGNYHRTRLTHTLEVSSLGRTIARTLRLNEDLTEALCLLHDVGHPPFGHTGEETLNQKTQSVGGFDHNSQALRIVELLESRYPHISGLNLSDEVLAGQKFRAKKKQPCTKSPILEVQAVDASDSISYSAHDADDALELGFLQIEDLYETSLWQAAARRVKLRYANLCLQEQRAAIVHDLIDWLVNDLLEHASKNINETGIKSSFAASEHPILVSASLEIAEQKKELDAFLFQRVYRHPKVIQYRKQVQHWIEDLFDYFTAFPETVPVKYANVVNQESPQRAVADFFSDMTDRSARKSYLQMSQRNL